MNPYYYLFYKLSRVLNKKGNNEMGSIYAISVVLLLNIIVIYVKLFHIAEKNSQGLFKIILGIIVLFIFGTNILLFQNKKRIKTIMNRFKNESEGHRRAGSFLVILYILLSLGLLILT